MAFIEAQDVSRNYGSTVALRNVNLQIERRAWISVTGPSGSGKSTLLNLLGGLDVPDTGRVVVDGIELHSLQEGRLAQFRRETVGYVFQQSRLIPYLSAIENVMLAQYFHSIPDRREASDLLDSVGLANRINHLPSQLSGGEQQRVCIARALANNPRLLIADEPTGNLDRDNTRGVLQLLRTMWDRGAFTVVLVTHDPYVARWAGRIVRMMDGGIVSDEGNIPIDSSIDPHADFCLE